VSCDKRHGFDRRGELAMQTIAPRLAEPVVALTTDPARAGILTRLTDGRAETASELALVAGVTPQTAIWHGPDTQGRRSPTSRSSVQDSVRRAI
jgi:hypothetical protein